MGVWQRLLTPAGGRDGDGWSCLGLRPPSAEGLAWPAPLSRPHRPPTFLGTGGLPLHLPAEHWVPCTLLRETGEAFAQHCGGLAEPPAEAAPPAPCLGTEVRQCFSPSASGCFLARGREIGTPSLTCPRTRRQGQRNASSAFPGRGDRDRCVNLPINAVFEKVGGIATGKAWIGEDVDFSWQPSGRGVAKAEHGRRRRGSYGARACDLPAVASTSGRCGGS